MASLQSLQTRKLADKYLVNQVSDDQIVLRLKYVGTGTITSVTVTTATDITMVTSDGGTDAYTWADYTTLGALADKINLDGIFEARVMNALRTDATGDTLLVAGAKTISDDGYYDLTADTTYTKTLTSRLSYDKKPGRAAKIDVGHRVHLMEIKTNVTLGGTYTMKLYESNPNGGGETVIWQAVPTTGSAASITWASGEGRITAKEGCDLVLVIADDTSVTGTLSLVGIAE